MGMPQYAQVTVLLLKLLQLPVCFQMQLKVLVMAYNALHGIQTAYLLWCRPGPFDLTGLAHSGFLQSSSAIYQDPISMLSP